MLRGLASDTKGIAMNQSCLRRLPLSGRAFAARTFLVLAAIGLSAPTWAQAQVNFIEPDKYADVPFMTKDRDSALKTLREHFDKLAKKLPSGQTLIVDVTDVDLAGRIDPARLNGQDVRVLRGMADWPMIALRYRIEAGGKVIKSGEERVADMNYMQSFNRYPAGEPLRYEKQMLDNWFAKEVLGTR